MNLYKITLNHSGEINTFYTHAGNPSLALNHGVYQLASKLKQNYMSLRQHFNGLKDNFKVTEEKEEE